MWYSLIDGRSSCTAITHLAWGTLEDIANDLINECNMLIDSMTDGMDEDEIEEEYGDDLAEFKEFEDCKKHTEEMIRSFYFSIGDCTVDVGCLVQGYPELVEAYAEYAEDKWTLNEWRLVPEIEETDEVLFELDEELRSLNDHCGTDCEMKYFVPMDEEDIRLRELLEEISNNEKYQGRVFEGPGIYFIIYDGKIREISSDAGGSPRGGWFPAIVSGPTAEESKCLQSMMDALGFDEEFFNELIEDQGEFDEESALEYFEEQEDEDSAEIYRKIEKKIASGKTPFESVGDFVDALGRYGLDSDCLYYEWEGEFIDLYDNIGETGESSGYYDSMSTGEWIELLENIDKWLV